MSGSRIFGFPTLSKKIIFVLSLIALLILSKSSTSKKCVVIPNLRSVSLNSEYVPPKSPPMLIISSPCETKEVTASVVAPMPELVATAPIPPSISARIDSSFAVVGFPIRE